jgi:hypothetical protein
MNLMAPSFDPTVFTKNRQRQLKHDVARQFFDEVVRDSQGIVSHSGLNNRAEILVIAYWLLTRPDPTYIRNSVARISTIAIALGSSAG